MSMYSGDSCQVSDALWTPMNEPPFITHCSRLPRVDGAISPVVLAKMTRLVCASASGASTACISSSLRAMTTSSCFCAASWARTPSAVSIESCSKPAVAVMTTTRARACTGKSGFQEDCQIVESDETVRNVFHQPEPSRPVRLQIAHVVKRRVLIEGPASGDERESPLVELGLPHVDVLGVVQRGHEQASRRESPANT